MSRNAKVKKNWHKGEKEGGGGDWAKGRMGGKLMGTCPKTNSGDVRQPMGTSVDLSKTRATFWVDQWVVVIILFVGPVEGKRLIGRNDMNFAPSHSPAMATISPPT